VQVNLKDDLQLAKYDLLLIKDNYGQTAYHIAAWQDYKDVLEILWGFAREVQFTLKNDLMLVKDKYGETVLHIASQCDYEEILEKVEGSARELQANLSDDLLTRDNNGQIASYIIMEAEDLFEGFFL